MNDQYHEERGWVVIYNRKGKCYKYAGFHSTRLDAKAYHAHCLYGTSEFVTGRKLSPEQQEAWDKCAANGDRVVRATVVWKP